MISQLFGITKFPSFRHNGRYHTFAVWIRPFYISTSTGSLQSKALRGYADCTEYLAGITLHGND